MITLVIIALSSYVSYRAFKNRSIIDKLIFNPTKITPNGWYRFFSYGIIHADYTHLIFNMLTFYFFGQYIEQVFTATFGITSGSIAYLLLYILALPVSIFPTYIKNKNNPYYQSLGASGAVSAVVFAFILINPMSYMGIMFIPVMIPAFIFGIIYVILSIYLEKKQVGNINHTAHITGAVFGLLFVIIIFAVFAEINLVENLFRQIQDTSLSKLFRIGY